MSAAASVVPATAARVGLNPIESVHLMENHDQAYYLWRDAGVKDRILVHIDAHHDMWWIKDNSSLSIANFICPALKEGLVREVYRVVPDATWESFAGRRALRKHLARIRKGFKSPEKPRFEARRVTATILGMRFVICSLDTLPRFAEPVLLDIDTDYLVIPRTTYGDSDGCGPLP